MVAKGNGTRIDVFCRHVIRTHAICIVLVYCFMFLVYIIILKVENYNIYGDVCYGRR